MQELANQEFGPCKNLEFKASKDGPKPLHLNASDITALTPEGKAPCLHGWLINPTGTAKTYLVSCGFQGSHRFLDILKLTTPIATGSWLTTGVLTQFG